MKKTEWRGESCPPLYEARKNAGLMQLTVFADIERVSEDEWSAVKIEMPHGVLDYGSIVSAIIDSHYTNDQMQAIVNNHLIGEHEDAFQEMQEYRVYAKRTAKEIVDDLGIGEEVDNG